MSLGELLVVVLIAILVIKPEDIPTIIKTLNQLKLFFSKLKTDIFSKIDSTLVNDAQEINQNINELNFYLQKIIEIKGQYEGSYSLEKLKSEYHLLMQDKIDSLSNLDKDKQ